MSSEGESPVPVRRADGNVTAPEPSGDQDAVPAGLNGREIPMLGTPLQFYANVDLGSGGAAFGGWR